MDSNILRPISAWSVRQPDALAVECGSTSLTWAQLDESSDLVVNNLAAREVASGDRVVIVGRPSIAWATAALGIVKAGAILCPLNERNGPLEISQAITQLEPTLILVAAKFGDAVDAAVTRTGITYAIAELEQFANDDSAPVCDSRLSPRAPEDAPVCILSTSGSTGTPKGVVFTHRSLLNAFFEWCLQEPGFARVRSLNVSSMAFGAGLLNGFLGPLVLGGSVIFLPEWNPTIALRIIRDRKVTHLGATTIFYEQMAADPEFGDADLSSLEVAFTGGNPVTVGLIDKWSSKGIGLRQAYGLTESQSMASIPTVEISINTPESVGLGGVLNEFALKTADGRDCAAGEPGEIWISGPGLAAGYWRDEAQTKANFADGWLRTGDVGIREKDGLLRIVGRIKDVIISGGINIYAAELERVIMQLDSIVEVAVIGVSDDEFGETPAALIRTSAPMTAEDVINHCQTHLARYKTPRYVEFLTEPMPRTAGMKINKAPLRTEFADLPMRSSRIRSTRQLQRN